jgi:hypothetical protein
MIKQHWAISLWVAAVLIIGAGFAYAMLGGDACFQEAQKSDKPYKFSIFRGCESR